MHVNINYKDDIASFDGIVFTKKSFEQIVEKYVFDNKGIGYIEAVIALSEKYNLELDSIKIIISPIIKDKLEAEAINRVLFKSCRGSNTLPVENE